MRVGGFIILFVLFFLSLLGGTVGVITWVIVGVAGLGVLGYWFMGGRLIAKDHRQSDVPLKEKAD